MFNIAPNKKQKLSLTERYHRYLDEGPEPTDTLHNKYNIFDDLNSTDKAMMKEAKIYIARSDRAESHNEPGKTIRTKGKIGARNLTLAISQKAK